MGITGQGTLVLVKAGSEDWIQVMRLARKWHLPSHQPSPIKDNVHTKDVLNEVHAGGDRLCT